MYMWNVMGVDVQSLPRRGQQLNSEEAAGIDGSYVLKETWCKVPFLSGSKKHVEIFQRLLC